MQKPREWIRELTRVLGTSDESLALQTLRSVLHVLRDRLTINEAAQFGSQLPTLNRGVWYENWRPRPEKLKERRMGVFMDRTREGSRVGVTIPPEISARAVFQVLAKHVSAGEVEDVKRMLPRARRRSVAHSAPPVPRARG